MPFAAIATPGALLRWNCLVDNRFYSTRRRYTWSWWWWCDDIRKSWSVSVTIRILFKGCMRCFRYVVLHAFVSRQEPNKQQDIFKPPVQHHTGNSQTQWAVDTWYLMIQKIRISELTNCSLLGWPIPCGRRNETTKCQQYSYILSYQFSVVPSWLSTEKGNVQSALISRVKANDTTWLIWHIRKIPCLYSQCPHYCAAYNNFCVFLYPSNASYCNM